MTSLGLRAAIDREQMTLPVEVGRTHKARADLVFRQGAPLWRCHVVGVPGPLGPGCSRVPSEVDGWSGRTRYGRLRGPARLALGASEHVMRQRFELGGVQLREVPDLLPKQPVRGACRSEVQVPVVRDLRLLAKASHAFQRRHVPGGGLERGPWFHRQRHEGVATDQPLAIRDVGVQHQRDHRTPRGSAHDQKRARQAGGPIAQ